jgi:hypothetical protein
MESAECPKVGTCLQSCGIVGAVSLAEDAGCSGIVSKATCSAPLTVPQGYPCNSLEICGSTWLN